MKEEYSGPMWRPDACCCVCGFEVICSVNGGPHLFNKSCFHSVTFVVVVVVVCLFSSFYKKKKKKNKQKKVVSPVMAFGIDIGEITKMRCEVSVRHWVKKLTCERVRKLSW
jgi:RsiW-degrading membrane proteinase PrsW (M82 family)